jgi:3-hydroxyisobutyrate dehydrogenase-like beta-hydroxyacid dehydrogenase
MGAPMAAHLARAGHPIAVYNRTERRARDFAAAHGARAEATPAAAARGARFVFTCSGDDADLRSVALGAQGALAGMEPGALLVDHTTVSPGLARELAARAAERGCAFLDAPVSGGQSGAEQGVLAVMLGGAEADVARARPVLACYAKRIVHVGPVGSGQLAKLVNQICIAGLLEALAEGLHFARRAGLDTERVLEAVSGGAARSWQMENRAHSMLEGRFDFGFAVDWMRKDLGLALAEARRIGARLPATALVDQLYAELQARGAGRLDTSSLISLLER